MSREPLHSFRKILAVFLVLTAFAVKGQDRIYTYTFHEVSPPTKNIGDSLSWIILDSAGKLQKNEVLNNAFDRHKIGILQSLNVENYPLYVWFAFRLENRTDTMLTTRIAHSINIDSLWMYQLLGQDLTLIDLNGKWVKPSSKSVKSSKNYTSITLDPKSSKTYYLRYRASHQTALKYTRMLQINNHKTLVQYDLTYTVMQSLFGGWMSLAFILSVVLFSIFRERAFLFFAGLMFSFALYFLTNSDLLYRVFDYSSRYFGPVNRFSIAGQIYFGGYFVAKFIQLKKHLPKFYKLFILYVSTVAFYHVFLSNILTFNGFPRDIVANFGNLLSLVFILLLITPLILLIGKQQKESKIIFIAIGFLLLGAAYTILVYLTRSADVRTAVLAYQTGATIFSGIILYGMFEKFQGIRSEQQRAESLNVLRSQMYANVSHEFRTPLSLVMGPIKQVEENTEVDEHRQLLSLAYDNASKVLELIDQQLEISSIEEAGNQMRVEQVDLRKLIREIATSFRPLAKSRSMGYTIDISAEPLFHLADPEKIKIIINNLLSNAFKFTPDNGIVEISLSDNEEQVELIIQDSGKGIPGPEQTYIFNRYYHSEGQATKGTGIGLALVKDYVALHHGTIKVISAVNEGTYFEIVFPKNSELIVSSTQISDGIEETDNAIKNSPASSVAGFSQLVSEAKPRLLIIEDNDELRGFMAQILSANYDILTAVNGKRGVEQALEQLPDLIITDIMMPEMDGYEVLDILKNDKRSCLIPIVVLTAKASLNAKITGLNLGADGYLVKPFIATELLATIRNVMAQRTRIESHISQTMGLLNKGKKKTGNPLEQALIIKVMTFIADNLENPQLGAASIAEEVGMSMTHLNRKIKEITQMTPGKLITNYRLEQAVQLLQAETYNIAEISDRVGFGSSAYFIKCFKDKFGITPGAWSRQ